jgi:replicative DNA helicase
MDTQSNKFGRKSYIDILKKGLAYIEKRRNGDIKSLRTPWPGFNAAGIGGLEWGSMLTIGARPGAGKTMLVSQILRESHRLNPDQKFNILEFQFEMGDEQYASRQFAGEVALDYGVILSKDKRLDDFVVDRLKQYVEECTHLASKGIRRELISQSLTCNEMEEAIKEFYIDGGRKPLIVTIDHSWLIKKGGGDKDKFDVLYNTTEMLMKLKNQIPVTVLMVTQLNRSIDEAARKTPGSISNYPTSSDIFGGDALMQGSDMVVVLSRPFKSDIRSYGPYAYECTEDDVFMHLLKVRNADDKKKNIVFLKMDGRQQRMVEVAEFKADRPDGSGYIPYSQRSGGRGRTAVTAPIGSEL